MKPIQLIRRKIKNKKFFKRTDPILSRIYQCRGIQSENELKLNLESLISFKMLNGIKKAVNSLYKAIIKNKNIIVIGDFDTDGATSVAVVLLALNSMGFYNIDYLIPSRFDDGYGLSHNIVKKAIKKGAEFIITVDNGISSILGVEYANKNGIPVIITDHHLPPNSNLLPNAKAIVNPALCTESPLISTAGVGVAFYLMIAICSYLKKKKWFEKKSLSIPYLLNLLDLVALGTITDLVPLNKNNRILVFHGLNQIRTGKCRPGIQALLKISKCNYYNVSSNDLSFIIGPKINAAGRLHDMSIGVELLIAKDFNHAFCLAKKLNCLNIARKKIEMNMELQAIKICTNIKEISGITLYHPNWHQGIVGILASRMKERFHVPVIVFASGGNGILKGSGRSISGLHINNILKKISKLDPNLILGFGGHAMAVGLSLKEKNLKIFTSHFIKLTNEFLKTNIYNEIIWSDGELSENELTMSTASLLNKAGPWGESFPEPIFDGKFFLLKKKIIKKNHLKVLLQPLDGGPIIDGIAFNINTSLFSNLNFKKARLAYTLGINFFKNVKKLQILIKYIWPI